MSSVKVKGVKLPVKTIKVVKINTEVGMGLFQLHFWDPEGFHSSGDYPYYCPFAIELPLNGAANSRDFRRLVWKFILQDEGTLAHVRSALREYRRDYPQRRGGK
jgi:hypothetical protein